MDPFPLPYPSTTSLSAIPVKKAAKLETKLQKRQRKTLLRILSLSSVSFNLSHQLSEWSASIKFIALRFSITWNGLVSNLFISRVAHMHPGWTGGKCRIILYHCSTPPATVLLLLPLVLAPFISPTSRPRCLSSTQNNRGTIKHVGEFDQKILIYWGPPLATRPTDRRRRDGGPSPTTPPSQISALIALGSHWPPPPSPPSQPLLCRKLEINDFPQRRDVEEEEATKAMRGMIHNCQRQG